MEPYVYPSMIAFGGDGTVVRSGTGQIYAESDLSGTTPLAITDLNGLSLTEVPINDMGLTLPFRCESPEVIWRSGPYVVPLSSSKALREAAEQARQDANDALQEVQTFVQEHAEIDFPSTEGAAPNYVLSLDDTMTRRWLPATGGSGGTGLTHWSQVTQLAGYPSNGFPPAAHTHGIGQLRTTDGGDALASIVLSLLAATTPQAARTAIGAGTGNGSSNLQIGTTSTTAKAGNWFPTATDVTVNAVPNVAGSNLQAVLEGIGNYIGSGGGGGGGETLLVFYSSGAYPSQPTEPPSGVKLRVFYGPTPPAFPTWAGVLDEWRPVGLS